MDWRRSRTVLLVSMDVAIGVVAHVKRQTMANDLAAKINAHVLCFDDGSLGFRNHVQVWRQCALEQADWCLVVEDDAVPVQHFNEQTTAALRVAPSSVVSLYLGTDKRTRATTFDAVAKAQANDASWITHHKLLHAVAVAIRTPLVADMLAYVERKRYLPIDDAISGWRARHLIKQPVAYSSPSLVDHRDTESMIKHRDNIPRDTARTAIHVGTRTHWNSDSVTL